MEVDVHRRTVWKLTHASNHFTTETVDSGAYPFEWRLEVLLRAWDASTSNGERSWREAAEETATTEPVETVEVADIEGTSRVNVRRDHIDQLERIATVESPDVDPSNATFDELLSTVLERWNERYGPRGVGWNSDRLGN